MGRRSNTNKPRVLTQYIKLSLPPVFWDAFDAWRVERSCVTLGEGFRCLMQEIVKNTDRDEQDPSRE
jgi:hypothetical protein